MPFFLNVKSLGAFAGCLSLGVFFAARVKAHCTQPRWIVYVGSVPASYATYRVYIWGVIYRLEFRHSQFIQTTK